MDNRAANFAVNENGATMIEYALLVGLIALTLTVAVPPVVELFVAAFVRLANVYSAASQ